MQEMQSHNSENIFFGEIPRQMERDTHLHPHSDLHASLCVLSLKSSYALGRRHKKILCTFPRTLVQKSTRPYRPHILLQETLCEVF